MDVLPTIYNTCGIWCLGGDCISEMNCKLTDICECVLIGCLLIESKQLGKGVFEEVEMGEGASSGYTRVLDKCRV